MFDRVKISHRLWMVSALSGALFVTAMVAGWLGMDAASKSLQSVYEDRAQAMYALSRVARGIQENSGHIFAALQHDPDSPQHLAHAGHPVSDHFKEFTKGREEVSKNWDKYMATQMDADERRLADSFVEKRKVWLAEVTEARDNIETDNYGAKVAERFMKAVQVDRAAVMQTMDDLMEYQARVAGEEYAAAERRHDTVTWVFAGLVLAGAVVLIGLPLFTIRHLSGSLRQAGDAAEAIAGGDLTHVLPDKGGDEVGELVARLSRKQAGLRDLIGTLHGNADSLHRAAAELSVSSDRSAGVSEQQSESASTMAAAVEQLSVSIDQVEEHAREARSLAQDSGRQSESGGSVIQQSAGEMRSIAESVNATAGTIRELNEFSERISGIVGVISDIADQTNLLALNAAIEAARAGEQGRGFAVVADEVRKLAERTGKSTHEITEMIERIQQSTQLATQEMDAGVRRVNDGVGLAREAGDSITRIRDSADRVTRVVDDIGVSLKEQSQAAREIAQRVERIAQGAEENSSAARQTASSASEMRRLAGELQQLAGRFRV